VWKVLLEISKEAMAGRDVGSPDTWGDLTVRLEFDANEIRRQRMIETYAKHNKERAELLQKVEELGWPRIYVEHQHYRGEWVKGPDEWRRELASLELPPEDLQGWCGFGLDFSDYSDRKLYYADKAVSTYEQSRERRSKTKIAPDSTEGLALTDRAFRTIDSRNAGRTPAWWLVSALSDELGLTSRVRKPTGRVKHFIDAAVAAGRIVAQDGYYVRVAPDSMTVLASQAANMMTS
jgi:hypothetical protein